MMESFHRWRPGQGRDMSKYRSRHLVADHKKDLDYNINIVNVNIDVNFGQVPQRGMIHEN